MSDIFRQVTGFGPDELQVVAKIGVEPGVLAKKATGTAEKMVRLSVNRNKLPYICYYCTDSCCLVCVLSVLLDCDAVLPDEDGVCGCNMAGSPHLQLPQRLPSDSSHIIFFLYLLLSALRPGILLSESNTGI